MCQWVNSAIYQHVLDVLYFSCYRDAVLPKQCCGLGSPLCRWTIIGIGIMGLVFAATGAILGALRVTGRDHVAVSLLMIGKYMKINNNAINLFVFIE